MPDFNWDLAEYIEWFFAYMGIFSVHQSTEIKYENSCSLIQQFVFVPKVLRMLILHYKMITIK